MLDRAIAAFIAGRSEMRGLPVQYILVVKDERGREREVRRRYSEFAELVQKIAQRSAEPQKKMPLRVPMARAFGCLSYRLSYQREKALVEVLDALVAVAQRDGDDASEIRSFLDLSSLVVATKHSCLDRKASPGPANARLARISEGSEESTSASSLAEPSSDSCDSDDDAAMPQEEVATLDVASPCKIKGEQLGRQDGLPLLLGSGI